MVFYTWSGEKRWSQERWKEYLAAGSTEVPYENTGMG
jgi:hypothetical protein